MPHNLQNTPYMFFSAVAANTGVNVVKAVLDIRSPYCVSFRLAVFETARGRLRASSYGFKASLQVKLMKNTINFLLLNHNVCFKLFKIIIIFSN